MDSGAYLDMASAWGFTEADGPALTMEELCRGRPLTRDPRAGHRSGTPCLQNEALMSIRALVAVLIATVGARRRPTSGRTPFAANPEVFVDGARRPRSRSLLVSGVLSLAIAFTGGARPAVRGGRPCARIATAPTSKCSAGTSRPRPAFLAPSMSCPSSGRRSRPSPRAFSGSRSTSVPMRHGRWVEASVRAVPGGARQREAAIAINLSPLRPDAPDHPAPGDPQ